MVMLQVKTITKSGNVLDFDVVVLTHFQEKHPLEKTVHMFPLWENFSAFIGIFFKTLLLTIQVGLLLPRKCLRAACHPYPNPTRQISSCTSRPAARDCCSSASFLACSAARRLAWNACNLKGRQLISAHVFWWMLGNFKSKMEGCTYKNGLLQEVLMTFDPVNIDTSPVEKAGFMLEKPQKLGQTLPPRASAHASCSTKNNLPGHHLNHRNDSTKSDAELQNLDIQKSPSSISYPVEGKRGYPRAWCGHIETIQFRNCSSNCLFSSFFVGTECHDSLVSYNPTIRCINTSDWIILWISRVKKEASKYLTWHTRVVRFDLKDIPKILDRDTQLRCVVRDLAGGP